MYPRNPHYRTKEQRLQTFANFPTHFKATHEEFADAGTFFLSSFLYFRPFFIFPSIFFKFPHIFFIYCFRLCLWGVKNFLYDIMVYWFLTFSCFIEFHLINLILLRLFTVRVFSLFCTRFFPYLRLFFQISAHFFKFPPIFSYFLPFFHILLQIMCKRVHLLRSI